MKEFTNKTRCDVYIPLVTNDDENFLVELLDLCECYLEPIKYGICKEEVIEFADYEKRGISIIEFLKFKHYIADESCFLDLAQKYMASVNCIKITFENANYEDIERNFAEHSIEDFRRGKVEGLIQQIGFIINGEFIKK